MGKGLGDQGGEEPDCFIIDTSTVDADSWTDGFASIPFHGDD